MTRRLKPFQWARMGRYRHRAILPRAPPPRDRAADQISDPSASFLRTPVVARYYEADWNFADVQTKHNFAVLRLAQYERGPQRRMTCKRQFFLHCEDTHSYSTLSFHRRIVGQNESCFGEIHLPRHCL